MEAYAYKGFVRCLRGGGGGLFFIAFSLRGNLGLFVLFVCCSIIENLQNHYTVTESKVP